MAEEESKQPRKVKDLKARLGRTIAPTTPGAPIIPPIGGITPPPGMGAAPTGGADVPPPGLPIPPIGSPAQPGAPLPSVNLGAKQVVVPPFIQQQQEEEERRRAAKREKEAAQRAVIVVEGDVDESATGAPSRKKALMGVAAAVMFLGLALGYATGGMMADRRSHNAAVRTGKEMRAAIDGADKQLEEVRKLVAQALAAATASPGKAAAADYDALRALRGVENPFKNDPFSGKRYDMFPPSAVQGLFNYYLGVQTLFGDIDRMTSRNLSRARQTELDEAAKAVEGMASTLTGCVPSVIENRFMCNLVYIDPITSAEIKVRTTPTTAPQTRAIYTGQPLTATDGDKYVILTNMAGSLGVLGQRAGAFGEYRRSLIELNAALEELDKKKGQVTQALAPIVQLDEVFTF